MLLYAHFVSFSPSFLHMLHIKRVKIIVRLVCQESQVDGKMLAKKCEHENSYDAAYRSEAQWSRRSV